MDYRFPAWLRYVVRKLDFVAIPNLGALLAGIAVLAFVANQINPTTLDRFMFDPDLIFAGEWWRLFTFPFMAGFRTPLGLIFYCLYVYFIMQILESHWGAGPLTVFILASYVSSMVGALILRAPVDLSYYIMENVSLALGTLLPNLELSIYFILPIRAKWLALFWGVLILLQFLSSPYHSVRLFLFFAFLPYIVFFGPLGVRTLRDKWRTSRNRRKFNQDMWR